MKEHRIPFRDAGIVGTSALLALIVIGLPPPRLAEGRRNASVEVPKTSQQHLMETYSRLPLSFEANLGQTNKQVEFLSKGQGFTVFLTRGGEAVLVLGKSMPKRTPLGPDRLSTTVKPQSEAAPPSVLRMKLVGARRVPQVEALNKLSATANYFIGNDPQKWRTDVPTYEKVKFYRIYPGVDLVYYGSQRQLEHDFIVAPGADPSSIQLAVEGSERLSVDAQGDLVLAMKDGEVRFQKPLVYQERNGLRHEILSSYKLKGTNQICFQVATYDRQRPLIIDPVLSYSTYLGGSSDDAGTGIAVDFAGNAYVTGYTSSINFPGASSSTIQSTFGGGFYAFYDAVVAKIDPAGNALVYSTYLGGSGDDAGNGIAVDFTGNAYVTGYTSSTNFPGTNSSTIQSTYGGGADAFVAKINPAGNALVYSTYLGGSATDVGNGIAVDFRGDAYVTGYTLSTNFPGTNSSTIQATFGGGADAFVAKINPAGNALVYSTYLGGSATDLGNGIALDFTGNAYVTGGTISTDFPGAGSSAIQSTNGGGFFDAFVTKINPAGSALVYSTYLGGSGEDAGTGIAVDFTGNVYVTGYTRSTNFPGTSSSTIQSTFGGGYSDGFVAKINPAGNTLVYSTYLGGSGEDAGTGIGVDFRGNAYVTGVTFSSDFPGTSSSTIQATFGGGVFDAFAAKINRAGNALVYSTYLGGTGEDAGDGIAVDFRGNAYVTGLTTSTNFPGASSSTIQSTFGGGDFDAFVVKISQVPRSEGEGDDGADHE